MGLDLDRNNGDLVKTIARGSRSCCAYSGRIGNRTEPFSAACQWTDGGAETVPRRGGTLVYGSCPNSGRRHSSSRWRLVGRLTRSLDWQTLDWPNLSVLDVDTVLVRLRQALIGDRIRADVVCPAPECGSRIDIDFGIEQFLSHHSPTAARSSVAGPAEEHGWFYLARTASKAAGAESERISFRLPTVSDQLAVIGSSDGGTELARRCIRPKGLPARLLRRVEAVLEAMAPSLSADLQGSCPDCQAEATMYFDARWFCLQELRQRAAFLYQDVDLLARRYHWSETEILALPQARRNAYVDLARHVDSFA